MITIVTINYRNSAATARLLASLDRQTEQNFNVVIVDNDSGADEVAAVRRAASSCRIHCTVLSSPINAGFSGGNNIGIRYALNHGADWILLLNNDTTVDEVFSHELSRELSSVAAGIVGLPIQEPSGIARKGVRMWNTLSLRHWYGYQDSPAQSYVIGAAMALHRSVIETIGYLDESFFLYFEDAEYTERARRHGIEISYVDTPLVHHQPQSTTSSLGTPLLLRYHLRNSIRFNRLYAPLWYQIPGYLLLVAYSAWQVVKYIGNVERSASLALLQGALDGIVGMTGRIRIHPIIAFECESLEDVSWGTARQLRNLLTEFIDLPEVRQSYEITAYFKNRVPDEPWLRRTHVRAVLVQPWIPLSSFSLYFYVFLPIRCWFERPSVLYVANYMLPILYRGRSIVMLTEDVWHEMRGTFLPFRYRLAYRIFSTWAARHATRIMALTRASARNVASLFHIESRRIFVNELAVSPPHHRLVNSSNAPYVLYVGQGLPRRHLQETMLAFQAMASDFPGLTLRAVGPDKYTPRRIRSLADSINKDLGYEAIVWSERVSEEVLSQLYAHAKVFVYISDVEAFGLPPLEALSYNVPSILMDSPVHREVFGESAFYVKNAEPTTIARVLRESLNDHSRRDAIIRRAPEILTRYTWRNHAMRMFACIQEIL